MNTFKLLGLLLQYPSEDLQNHIDEVKAAISSEELVSKKIQKPLFAFMDDLKRRNLLRLQEEYVACFDRSRTHSLYLFEHVHGESRDRGQAMVNLSQQYKDRGLSVTAKELPDYLPLFLEYLSVLPFEEAQDLLGETVHIIAAIGGKLKAKKNEYSQVFRALEALTTIKADAKFVEQALMDAANEDTSLEALDKEWEETPAFDGAGEKADCGSCPQVSQQLSNLEAHTQSDANSQTIEQT